MRLAFLSREGSTDLILSLRLSQDPSCLTESKVGLAHRAPDSPHQWGPSRVLAASGNRAPELEVSAEPGGGGCSCHQPPNKEPWVPPQRAKGATHCRASNSETCHIWPKWSRKPSYAQTESLAGEGSPGCPHGGSSATLRGDTCPGQTGLQILLHLLKHGPVSWASGLPSQDRPSPHSEKPVLLKNAAHRGPGKSSQRKGSFQ